jgi:hypothetical protein
MFFTDLSPYSYAYTEEEKPRPLNIGWLDHAQPFETGNATEEFRARLFEICKAPVQQMRGFHGCPFCRRFELIAEERGGEVLYLGSAEVRVAGADEKVYAAPDLILHYVTRHRYRPPEEFIRAVCRYGSP